MAEVNINLAAVAIAAIANVLIGFAWYWIFAKPWMKLAGKTEKEVKEEKSRMPANIGGSIAAAAVLAYALSWIVGLSEAANAAEGAIAGAQ